MVDELNADILEVLYTLEDRTSRGAFSAVFTDAIVCGVQGVRAAGRLNLSTRT